MKLDRKLNLVIPVETEKGEVVVTATPISADTFSRYFFVIAKTFSRIHTEGLGQAAGPRIAAHLLRQIAEETNQWESDGGVAAGLMAEIRRLAMAKIPGEKGPQDVPWDQVRTAKLLDDEDIEEVENLIVFFTVGWSMYHKRDREVMLSGASRLWNARIESSTSTA